MHDKESEVQLNQFLNIHSQQDICDYLNVTFSDLTYILYRQPDSTKYVEFQIRRKNGGVRTITTPNHHLLELQRKLILPLNALYKSRDCVHGFVEKKCIISNAKKHVRKKILINIDLSNFFDSINYGRVRGIFLAQPFGFNTDIATVLAQIICFQNKLPQGAPTSPIISNFVCHRLDNQLLRFAIKNRLTYTRYADDLTFSTNLAKLPLAVGAIKDTTLSLSDELKAIVINNGFKINENKVRYAFKYNRQEVTGLIVNRFVNVHRRFYNQVRSLIRLWEIYQAPVAAKIYSEREHLKWKAKGISPIAFVDHVIGKVEFIGQVKGKDDPKYIKLYKRVKEIEPTARLSIIEDEIKNSNVPIILTEGKTDWKHMAAALKRLKAAGMYVNLEVKFQDYLKEKNMSNGELLKVCKGNETINPSEKRLICIFDRDDKNTTAQVTTTDGNFKNWGNNVFSFVLPVPAHRDFENICIEHFYTDAEIKTYDQNNRRLFLSTEFKNDGQHMFEQYFSASKHNNSRFPTIIDSGVKDSKGESVALSKNLFSNYVYEGKKNFNGFNIDSFIALFDTIEQICKRPIEYGPEANLV